MHNSKNNFFPLALLTGWHPTIFHPMILLISSNVLLEGNIYLIFDIFIKALVVILTLPHLQKSFLTVAKGDIAHIVCLRYIQRRRLQNCCKWQMVIEKIEHNLKWL